MSYGWVGKKGFASNGGSSNYGFLQELNSVGGGVSTLVYQLDLTDGSLTPQTGGAPTFSRTGTRYFYDGPTEAEVGSVATTNPAFGSYGNFIDSNSTGLYMGPATKNELVQSEAPGTTWTELDSPTSVNNSVGTWGDITYGSIVAAGANDGISQTSGYAAASEAVILSAWMAVPSGTLDVTFTIEGVGGTPESETQTFTVTTVPKRLYFYKTFTASATGNVKVDITCDAAGTLYLGGMQLEGDYSVSSSYPANNYPGPYVKTTTAAATVPSDQVILPDGTVPITSGTWAGWFRFDSPSSVIGPSGYNGIIFPFFVERSDGGAKSAIQLTVDFRPTAIGFVAEYNDIANFIPDNLTPSEIGPGKWHHLAYTWDHDGTDVTGATYLNGAQVGTATQTTSVPTARANGERILGISVNGAGDYSGFNGYASTANIKIYNEAKDSTAIQTLYDAEKADFENQFAYYGYPASGRYEPDVVAQWILDETSGNIVDEVSGITLAATGTPDYEQAITGQWAKIGPGINYAASGEQHAKGSAESSLDLDVDFVFEAWYQKTGGSSADYLYSTWADANNEGLAVLINPGTATLTVYMKNTGGTLVSSNFVDSSLVTSAGEATKLRLTADRDGNLEAFVDGVSIGTNAISSLDGLTLPANDVAIGNAAYVTSVGFTGVVYEVRLTIGNLTNNSGGPGGG